MAKWFFLASIPVTIVVVCVAVLVESTQLRALLCILFPMIMMIIFLILKVLEEKR